MATTQLLAKIAEVNRTKRPEHDRPLRLWILAAVCTSVIAVTASGGVPIAEPLAVLALLPVGFGWSYRHRDDSNLMAKVIISLLAAVVLVRFFQGIFGISAIDDARIPLTLMFLEIQVLHSFDLPQRRDLVFTLSSSLALMGLSLANGPQGWLMLAVVGYLVCAGASLHRYQHSVDTEWMEGATRTGEVTSNVTRDPGPLTGMRTTWWIRYAGALVAVAAMIFVSVPLRSDASLAGLPFEFGTGDQRSQDTGRVGGDLPFDQSDGDGSQQFDEVEYFGFAERVDPRSVGELSDQPVLRVRTNRPWPLRGVVFDVYDDGVWGRSEEQPPPMSGLPVQLRPMRGRAAVITKVTQTVELLRPTPNLMFAAAEPREIWTAARSVTPWSDGTLTTSVEMSPGTIYSVVSDIDSTPRETMRQMPANYRDTDDVAFSRWTDLPDSVPDRVHQLAAQLAGQASSPTPYAIAEAMQAWIGANVQYRLDSEPTPASEDPADHILFESRQGWCEPIATSMVVMLRSVGIPARFVTGFQPGQRDILSGRYIVRGSDAHAWVEIFVPDHGWVPFDPTGATTPVLDPEGAGPQILLLDILQWIRDRLPTDPLFYLVVVGSITMLNAGALLYRRQRRARRLWLAGPWAMMLHMLAEEGLQPQPTQTPAEVISHARRALPHLDPSALEELRCYEEVRRYTDSDVDREGADRALSRLS